MIDLKYQLMNRTSGTKSSYSRGSGERFFGYALSGFSLALGIGLVTGGLADNVLLGLGIGGLALCVGAVTLITILRKKSLRQSQGLRQDYELIRTFINKNDYPTIITNNAGELIVANDAYRILGAESRRPIASILDVDDSDSQIMRMINDVRTHDKVARIYPSNKGQLSVEVRQSGYHLTWELKVDSNKERIRKLIVNLQDNLEPFFENMQMGLAFLNHEEMFIYANNQLRDWLQLSPDQTLPSKLRLKDNATRLIATENVIYDVQVSSNPAEYDNVDLGRILIIRNLERFAGAALKSSHGDHLIDSLIDAAPIGVVVVDASGVIEDINQKMVLFGQSLGAPDYKNILDIMHEEYHAEFKQLLCKVSDGKIVRRHYEVRFVGQKEKVGQFYFSSINVEDKRFVVLYVIDTSHQKSIEKQFVQAQKMQAVGQLAGGVAHDFNNLLTAIIGFCDLSLTRHDAKDSTFSDLMNIKQNANRASNLVRQLLAFSRQQTLRPKVLSITDVIAELSNLVRRLIGENISLEIEHGRDLNLIKVDQGQLEQVIINLAVNAKDAMPKGGRLTISTRNLKSNDPLFDKYDVIVPSDYVLVELEDTGTGISEEHANKIFEPFFTTKDVGKGTGLGLATVYGIVKQTGGYVYFDSKMGEGTNFMIFLKAHLEDDPKDSIEQEEVKAVIHDLTGQGTILLVEDEDAVRLFAMRALTNKGYKVHEASSGEDGLEIYAKYSEEIDLVITDVIMPEMDGPSLVKAAKGINEDLKVIFISGYAEDVVRKDLEDDSCYFLPKPFSLNELATIVKNII